MQENIVDIEVLPLLYIKTRTMKRKIYGFAKRKVGEWQVMNRDDVLFPTISRLDTWSVVMIG
jgi:hypothetical protein